MLAMVLRLIPSIALAASALASESAVSAGSSDVVPECKPKRAIVTIAYEALNLPLPRIPPTGDIEFGFTILSNGTVADIKTLSSEGKWEAWDTAAQRVLANAKFEAAQGACRQTMRFRFSLKP
jgi:TonB family protein